MKTVVAECLEVVGEEPSGGGQSTVAPSEGADRAASATGEFSCGPSDQTALPAYDSLLAKCDHIGRWCSQQWGKDAGCCEDLYRFVAPGITKRLTRMYWIYRLWMLASSNSSITPTVDKLTCAWVKDYDIPRRWARDNNFHSSLATWQGLPSSYHYAQLDTCFFYAGKGQRILHKGLEFGGLLPSGVAGDIALLLKEANMLPDVMSACYLALWNKRAKIAMGYFA